MISDIRVQNEDSKDLNRFEGFLDEVDPKHSGRP